MPKAHPATCRHHKPSAHLELNALTLDTRSSSLQDKHLIQSRKPQGLECAPPFDGLHLRTAIRVGTPKPAPPLGIHVWTTPPEINFQECAQNIPSSEPQGTFPHGQHALALSKFAPAIYPICINARPPLDLPPSNNAHSRGATPCARPRNQHCAIERAPVVQALRPTWVACALGIGRRRKPRSLSIGHGI